MSASCRFHGGDHGHDARATQILQMIADQRAALIGIDEGKHRLDL
jgi:hypothetical protein